MRSTPEMTLAEVLAIQHLENAEEQVAEAIRQLERGPWGGPVAQLVSIQKRLTSIRNKVIYSK